MFARIAKLSIGISTALAIAVPATAQTATRKDSKTDWSIFVEEPPAVQQKTCWLASAPQKVENSRNGQPVEVDRGEIAIFVLYIPGEGVSGEVSFASGYPFGSGASAVMQIGSARYTLDTDPDTPQVAFGPTPDIDSQIRNSMKKGAEAVVTAQSARGTDTKDTFSLTGFTAAVEEIEKLCGA